MNSPTSSENSGTSESLQELATAAQDKAQEAFKVSQTYVKENPWTIALGALFLGLLVGALCGQRPPKRKDTAQAAKDLVDDVFAQIADRLPNIKKAASNCPSALQEAGKKLKWW